jgi:hypothetical protein
VESELSDFHIRKYEYADSYSNSNMVVKWIQLNLLLSIFFSTRFHPYSVIPGTIRIRQYKTVRYVYKYWQIMFNRILIMIVYG